MIFNKTIKAISIFLLPLCLLASGLIFADSNADLTNSASSQTLHLPNIDLESRIKKELSLLKKCTLGWCKTSDLPPYMQKIVPKQCSGGYVQNFVQKKELFSKTDDALYVLATNSNNDLKTGEISLAGSVEISQGKISIRSENGVISPGQNFSYGMRDNVRGFYGFDFNFRASSLNLTTTTATQNTVPLSSFSLQDGEISVASAHLRANFKELVLDKNKADIFWLRDGRVTRCEPSDNSWSVGFNEIEIDVKEGLAYANDIALYVYDIPVFYSPYLVFPITKKRRSGFLFPKVSSGGYSQYDLTLPIYWNIAPNVDATLYPHIIGKNADGSAFLLEEEMRAMFTENSKGNIYIGNTIGGSVTQEVYSVVYAANFDNNLDFIVDYSKSKQNNYFSYDTSLDIDTHGAQDALWQEVALKQSQPNWSWHIKRLAFQELKDSLAYENDYMLNPDIAVNYNYHQKNTGFILDIKSNFTNFVKDENNETSLTNSATSQINRLVNRLSVGFNWREDWWSLSPKVTLYNRNYNSEIPIGTENEKTYQDNILSLKLHSGLNFVGTSENWTHRLLPQIIAKYTESASEQNYLPLLDTNKKSFGLDYILGDNLFNGLDRIAQENSVAWVLQSDWQHNGNKDLYIETRLGQVTFAETRTIFTDTTSQDEQYDNKNKTSPWLFSASIIASRHQFFTELHWHSQEDIASYAAWHYNYLYKNSGIHIGNTLIKNIQTRMETENLKQLSFVHKISPTWVWYLGYYVTDYPEKESIAIKNKKDFVTQRIDTALTYGDCCKQFSITYERQNLITKNSNNIQNSKFGIQVAWTLPDKSVLDSGSSQNIKETIFGYRDKAEPPITRISYYD